MTFQGHSSPFPPFPPSLMYSDVSIITESKSNNIWLNLFVSSFGTVLLMLYSSDNL
jgi:hypothetical protein